MSLYQLQKLFYELNRDRSVQALAGENIEALLERYELTPEERGALLNRDIGLLYVLGVNGQLLMHFAGWCGVDWPDYLQAMRDGVQKHGPVRAGVYAMTTGMDDKVAGL